MSVVSRSMRSMCHWRTFFSLLGRLPAGTVGSLGSLRAISRLNLTSSLTLSSQGKCSSSWLSRDIPLGDSSVFLLLGTPHQNQDFTTMPAFLSFSSDPDSHALSQFVVHPARSLHTSKLLLHIKGTLIPHFPCSSFFVLVPHCTPVLWAVPPAISQFCDLLRSSSSFCMFPRLHTDVWVRFPFNLSDHSDFSFVWISLTSLLFGYPWLLSCLDIPTLYFPSASMVSSLTVELISHPDVLM